MVLNINFKSGKPVHVQIIDQVREAAASGAIQPGEALPSIGPLALELRINRNAIVRAYSELESIGLVELLADRGHVLRDRQSAARQESRRKLLLTEMNQAIVAAPTRVQATLMYSVVTGVLALLYFVIVGGVGILIVRAGIVRGEIIAVVATVLVAAAFMPVRTRIQEFVDRVVFSKRYELARAIQTLKAEAAKQPTFDLFIKSVIEQTGAMLNAAVEWIDDYGAMLPLVRSFPSLRSSPVPLAQSGGLLMPIVSDNELIGVLSVSQRATGEAYDAEDVGFLAAVGEQAAIAANHFRLRREKQEGEYALDIQQGLLPHEIPQVPGFSIAGAWQPARAVGGDYYDVFELSSTQLALVVADVAGKGIPAALLMANLQATVKAYATPDIPADALCDKVNRAVAKTIKPGRFITFFYAVLDSSSRKLSYSNAGHNPPLIARRDGSSLKLDAGGPVLGVLPGASYDCDSVDLRPGDRLVICTDGITEATDSQGVEFGEERLLAILQNNGSTPASGLRDEIMQRVSKYCGDDFADDATLLAVAVE